MEGKLILSSAPLADICGLLGITTTQLAAVETGETLAYTLPVEASDAAQLDLPRVHAFVDHYRDAAKITIRTGDLTEIVIEPGVTDAALAAFTKAARLSESYEATVSVDKTLLAQRLTGSAARTVRVFLFAEALRRALLRGISRFEADVWANAPGPLLIAVLDTEVMLRGAHLTILGGDSLRELQATASQPAPDDDFGAINEVRDQHIGWDTRWVRALTPWHFDVTGTCADLELLGLLRAQLVKLAVLFTCDRARSREASIPPSEILAEYRGREHVAIVPIDERAQLDCTDSEIAAVMRAVGWCYQRHGTHGQPDWVSDRLPFIQTRVAQALEPYPADGRFVVLARSMPYLLEGVEWQWKAFMEGKVNDYLDRVEQVENTVSDTVAAFADRTTDLVKALTDTILAAVAVLIGSFIAAAFATPFNATLFRIGVLTYASYVVLFPGALGLLSSAGSLRGARAEFDIRIKRFNEMLFPDKVKGIIGSRIGDVQRTYYRWLAFVAAAYLAVAVAAAYAAANIPNLVAK